MPDGLYERDVLIWSQQQADLLRRLGRGERVNDVDWANVAEEIEDVGLSELHSVESYLILIMVHALKIQASPDDTPVNHWNTEIATSQDNAQLRFTPSMRQRIDLAVLYSKAIRRLRIAESGNKIQRSWPDANPFTLDQLLNTDPDDIARHLSTINPD
jgi:hypothetical protein